MSNLVQEKSINEHGNFSNEVMKAYLYLLDGQISSKYKVFDNSIKIDKEDLNRLNLKINEKLKSNNVYHNVVNTSADVRLENNKSIAFASFEEFLNHHWEESEAIETLLLKWDFFIMVRDYEKPQRHTVTVRINTDIKAMDVLQAIFNSNPNELEQTEINMSSIVCRVDFINSFLCDEVINLVHEWIKTCEPVEEGGRFIKLLQKYKRLMADISKYSTACAFLIISIFIYKKYSLNIIYFSLTFFVVFSTVIKDTSFYFGKQVYENLRDYGDSNTFQITRGDKNKEIRITKNNKRYFTQFIKNFLFPVFVNLISGYLLLIFNKE